jgi:serine/threonine protein kinase
LRSGADMSVEPSELSTDLWTRWQGHAINGVFPLGRYLGCSDHSGVFLTVSAERGLSEVAIKLLPADRALAELQLPRWRRARTLAHPHLLGMLEWGGCQLEGLPYLYIVMEYADQTLAQLLLHRSLTDDEAREMLVPTLDALAFLHGQDLLQGNLTPANIMVVGDQLKLASDTIRRVGEGKIRSHAVSDSAEDRHESSTTAADIRALGMTLCEALTRRSPSGLGELRDAAGLPGDFSPAFRDVVTRCLSPKAQDRPNVSELLAWTSGTSAQRAPATVQPVALVAPGPRTPDPAPTRPVPEQGAPSGARPSPASAALQKPPSLLSTMLWVVVILALVWVGVRLIGSHRGPAQASPPVQSPGGSSSQTPGTALSAATQAGVPVSGPPATKPPRSDAANSSSAPHEVIPDVSASARRTIRGHIKVWVRVIVEQDGAVSAAVADRAGPSNYFERIAIEAAKKWTFPPADTPSRRLMQVRFDFGREGTTARAVALH